MLTWPNGIDLESSGKIENGLERSLRQKNKEIKNKNQQLQITRKGWWEIEGNGGRFTLWTYATEKLKSWKVAVSKEHNPTE